MALRTLWSRIDWPRNRESAEAFWETTATRSCIPCASPVPKRVPRMATPTVEPICRENVAAEVATPICWGRTAFWMASV